MAKKRKRRKVPKDKATDLPKKYLSGLKGSKRSSRASLLKTMYGNYTITIQITYYILCVLPDILHIVGLLSQ